MLFVAYGARYYDPRTNVWQSVDPVLNDYFDGKINGGVFAPKNLQLYSYTYNNPVNLTDPDGKCVNSGSSDWLGRLTQGNCSDYPTAKEVAVGVGNFIPVFGNAIATYESTSGESLSDGHKLSDTERTIAAAGIVAGPLSKVGGKVVKYTKSKISNTINKAIKRLFPKSIKHINDILENPQLLSGKTPNEVEKSIIHNLPSGWKKETLGKGSKKGKGLVFREYTPKGNPTGQQIRWHPGGGHHGPDPYWRVINNNGKSGIIR